MVGDFWVWSAVRRARYTTAHTAMPTLAYRTTFPQHYGRFGKTPPPGSKPLDDLWTGMRRIAALRQVFGDSAATIPDWRSILDSVRAQARGKG